MIRQEPAQEPVIVPSPILSVDPGTTVGWALLGDWIKGAGKVDVLERGSFKLVGRGTKRLSRLQQQMIDLVALLSYDHPSIKLAVVEKLEGFSYSRSSRGGKALNQKALQTNRDFTTAIILALDGLGIEVETMNPVGKNGWKLGMRSDLSQVVKMLWDITCDQHTADAIMMGNQFINMKRSGLG